MATESDNVNSGALGTLVAVGTIAFFGIALVVTALVRAETAEEVAKKEVSADRAYRDLLAEQTAHLNAPAAYKDRGRGLVSLPIDRAMELTVSSLVKDPNSATPPAPVGGTGGTGGAEGEAAGGSAGTGGTGGSGGSAGAAPVDAAPGEAPQEPAPEGDKPKDEKEGAKPEKKKEAPKPKAPVAPAPAAPAPVAPTPAPAPAPNGQ